MAFYAEMVRQNSYLINDANMIYMYHRVLAARWKEYREQKHKEYEEWYSSLTDEEREEVDRKKRAREERERMELMNSMKGLLMMPLVMLDIMGRQSRHNTYGGMYNVDGTPNEDFFHELSERRREEQERNAIDVEAVEV